MIWKSLLWAWRRYRPEEGWLSFFLLLGIVFCLTAAVISVEWIPEATVVALTAPLGLILGTVVARGRWHAAPAWLLLLAYGLLTTLLYLGQLLPPLSLLVRAAGQSGAEAGAAAYFRQQVALFVDRVGSWYLALSSGGASRETVVFAFGLGLIAWLLAAYAAWSTYRQRRPLAGLGVLGIALALNGYFGGEEGTYWSAALFVGLAIFLVATTHFAELESRWRQRDVDYSREIRLELLFAAGATAGVLLVLAFLVPTVRLNAVVRAFRGSEAVQQAEALLERAFGGVDGAGGAAYRAGGRGVFPRSFLLGDAPELYETVMMTATVRPMHPAATHWRAASYDIYTGRGWALSQERAEVVPAGEALPLPPHLGQSEFEQTVSWLFDERDIRYTIGLPLRLTEESRVYWRGLEDLSRVHAVEGTGRYTATSRLATAAPAALSDASTTAVPPLILARYTALPEEVPARVLELAQEVVAGHTTPYAQARALETFLRQYPYSLQVPAPPRDRDPVDYFLFELQTGYCDYYATAMAVLARSLGLPARLATGYLAQPPAADGVQTIYQVNAHAWTEIYFAGYGWVEFEPTAAFPTMVNAPALDSAGAEAAATPAAPVLPPPLPAADDARLSPLWVLPLFGLLLLLWLLWRWRRHPALGDGVLWSYGRLQQTAGRLGVAPVSSQTPAEFEALLLERLAAWEQYPRLQNRLAEIRAGVARLIALFVRRQYSRRPASGSYPGSLEARTLWRHLQRRFWLLRLYRRLFPRRTDEISSE